MLLKSPQISRYLKHELIFTISQCIITTICKEHYDLATNKKGKQVISYLQRKKDNKKKKKSFIKHRPNIW